MAPTLKQSALADTSALVVDGNTPTTVAGDDYGHLSSKALKRLCTERGLAVRGDHAALVRRLLAGKKAAGPKSSKERKAKSRNNRPQAKVVPPGCRSNLGWFSGSIRDCHGADGLARSEGSKSIARPTFVSPIES